MKKKILSILLCTVFLCTLSLPVYADSDSSSGDGYSAIISDIPTTCPTCGEALHAFWWSTSGAEVELQISEAGKVSIPAGAGSLAHIDLRCSNCGYEKKETRVFGLDIGTEKPGNWEVKQAPSGIGRKDLPGYADDNGTPSVDSSGRWSIAVSPKFSSSKSADFDSYTDSGSAQNSYGISSWSNHSVTFKSLISGGNISYPYVYVCYFFTVPFSGALSNDKTVLYSCNDYQNSPLTVTVDDHLFYAYANSSYSLYQYYVSFPYSACRGGADATGTINLADIIVYLTPDDDLYNKQTSITINNNTWNGNIYVDSSTNLTYIYPQYTTINDAGETVTNISNNPIIYNSETDQYYTYDSTTNNYYYITYVEPTPTPSPSPSPSPTPDPDNPDATPTPDPGTTPTPTPGGGTSGGNSGNNSNISGGDDEGLFGWLWDLLKDLVKAILKAIFKVLSGILGFLIWLVERVGLLFPFLPAPAVAALGAGVVLVFVIKIIRFIRG